MEKPCRYTFANELTAEVVQVDNLVDLPVALDKIGLHSKCPTLVLVGGASGISQADMSRLQRLFVEAIAPIAQDLGVAVVDGGTDAGIMRFISQARTAIRGTLPLLGVAAVGTVILPDVPPLVRMLRHWSHTIHTLCWFRTLNGVKNKELISKFLCTL